MVKKKVDWRELWKAFDRWYEGIDQDRCKECGKLVNDYPDWVEQKKKIQWLLEKYVLH